MHFAYPPRKSSNPPPFRPRTSKLPHLRRSRLKTLFLVLGAFVLGLYLLSGSSSPGPYHEHVPSGSPPVVIVTVLDATRYHAGYLNTVKENRELYARKHGGHIQASSWPQSRELIPFRLRGHDSPLLRLRHSRRSPFMGQGPGHAPCADQIPRLHLCVVPRPTRIHHGSEQGTAGRHGTEEPRAADDQGLPCRSSR